MPSSACASAVSSPALSSSLVSSSSSPSASNSQSISQPNIHPIFQSLHTVLAMMNIEKFIDESDVRHQKLLQNIVKILKINDLLEEYRLVVNRLQASCSCKKAKATWEQLSQLESKYKELILESCRGNSSLNDSDGRLGPSSAILSNNLKELVKSSNSISAASSGALSTSQTHGSITGAGGNLTFTILNPNIKIEPNHQSGNSIDDLSCKKVLVPGKLKLHQPTGNSLSDNNNNTITIQSVSGNAALGLKGSSANLQGLRMRCKDATHRSHRNQEMSMISLMNQNGSLQIGQYDSGESADSEGMAQDLDDSGHGDERELARTGRLEPEMNEVNLIEEEDIEDDDEDDAEEELDIEEYMALSEILEKESALNKFEKEPDPKNEFILAIRDMSTKDVICYECIVGGTCGFLSRERQRMLLHISKHFQVGDGSQPDFDGEQMSDDSDQQIVSTTGSSSVGLSSSMPDLDISIIPLNKTASPDHSTGSGEPKYAMLFKDEHGTTAKLVTKASVTRSGSIGNSAIAMSTKAIAANIVNKQPVLGSVKSDKPIRCLWDNCTFQCDQNYKLRTHIRQVHEKVRPYLCDWPGCFGAYKTRSNLASHRMVHTGERPYICDYPKCGAKFARKYDCERHRRIHSEKMFACEWPGCGKRLCDPYNLERHMMVHKGELPFRCPISNCYRGFRELRYLRDHMVNTHKFLPDTNQLRAACLSSAKMSSISGYNLNDSSCSEASPGGGAVGGVGMASDHGNNEILESLVNKIVNNQSNGSKNRTGQPTGNRLRQSTSSSTVNEDDDQQEKHHGSEPDEDSCSTIENEVYLDEQDQQEAKAESNAAQNGHQEHDENNNRTLASDDELKVQMDQSGQDDDEVLVIKKVTSQTTASSKRANLRSSLASTRPKRSRRY